MRFLRLNRKQKIIRNFLLIALTFLLFEWMLGFPVLTREGVLRRAERGYLMEGSELLFIGREEGESDFLEGTIFARNGNQFLAVNYYRTPLGLQGGVPKFYDEPDGICVLSRDWWPLEVMAMGTLEGADRAELEITIHWDGSSGGRRWNTQRTYTAEGERQNDYCFTFRLEPYYSEEDGSPEAEMERAFFSGQGPTFTQEPVLRLYGADGELLHEKKMEYIDWEFNLHW
nr:hypothetical protein [uncultured Oscillibacter sp.]